MDSEQVSLDALLLAYFHVIDPTVENRQGNDVGTSYRTGIYPDNEEDWITARQFVAERQKFYDRPIVTEVQRLVRFYDAEEEHQDYLVHHPHGYCHVDFSRILPQERKAK